MDQRYVMIQFPQAIGKIVFVVVDLKIRERPLKLTLPILYFTKYRLDNPPLFGHFADRLSKCLLAAPDFVEPILYIDGFALALLQGCPLFGIGERFLKCCDCFLGVAVYEMLDRRVELILRSIRDQSALSEAPEAIAQ